MGRLGGELLQGSRSNAARSVYSTELPSLRLSMTQCPRRHRLVSFAAMCTLIACTGSTPGDAAAAAARQQARQKLLVTEIRRDLAGSVVPIPWNQSEVAYDSEPSAMVPGLEYHWATYRSREVTHAFASSVVGTMGSTSRVIHTAQDWASLAGPWRPRSVSSAIRACVELVHLTHERVPHARGHVLLQHAPASQWPLLGDSARVWRHVRDTTGVTLPALGDSTWRISLWMVEPSPFVLVWRYRCVLPAGSTARSRDAVLVATDSILRTG